MGSNTRSLLVVEDDPRLQEAAGLLLRASGYQTAVARTGAEALSRLAAQPFDVAVVDLGLPDMDGTELIASVVRRWPKMPVLVLTVADTRERILAALRAGACGYLFKEDMGTRLAPALEEVLAGGVPLSPAAAQLVLATVRRAPPEPTRPAEAALTSREHRVLELLTSGLTYEEVAQVLEVSINTVRTHVRSIYAKLDVNTKAEAVMVALGQGLVLPPRS
jgi:DNA-binding NarL/FixJ family response regulator